MDICNQSHPDLYNISETKLFDLIPKFSSSDVIKITDNNESFLKNDLNERENLSTQNVSKSDVKQKLRKRNPENWKQNVRKRNKNKGKVFFFVMFTLCTLHECNFYINNFSFSFLGLEYITANGKICEKKKLGPPCTCKEKCFLKIGLDSCEKIFKNFWKLGDHALQNAYIGKNKTCKLY